MKTGDKIKYLVTGPFGLRKKGEITNAIFLFEDSDTGVALIFHPASKKRGECGSVEFAKKRDDGLYVLSDEGYVNLDKDDNQLLKFLSKIAQGKSPW